MDNNNSLGTFQPVTGAFSLGSNTSAGAVTNLESIISNAIGIITVLASIFFIIYFLMAAFSWVTAGDSGSAAKAREKITMAVLGLVLIVISYAIVGLIGTIIGINILQPGQVILNQLTPSTNQDNQAPSDGRGGM